MKTQEQLKRDMYAALDKIRRAKKHPSATAVFETALEAYLESVRAQAMTATAEQLLRERDDLQARLHAVDSAYAESQKLNAIAGEELREAQRLVGYWKGQAEAGSTHRQELQAKLREATKRTEDQLVVIKSQREAFGELYVKHHQATRKGQLGGPSLAGASGGPDSGWGGAPDGGTSIRNCNGPAPLRDAKGSDCGWCCTAYQQ